MSGDVAAPSLKELVRSDPDRLIEILRAADLPPHMLTFAAEYAAEIESDKVHEPLIRLLDHSSPVVREGAVYGLNGHRSAEITAALECAFLGETSQGVKEALFESLEMRHGEELDEKAKVVG